MSTFKSLKKVNLNNFIVSGKPQSWIVRELYDEEKHRSVIFELGVYVTPNIFLGIPLHYSFKKNLEPYTSATKMGDYTYYLVPNDMEFSLSKFTNKKGIERPVLIPVDDEHPAMLITCVVAKPEKDNEKIIYVDMPEEQIVIRDFIDKNRDMIALVVSNPDTKIENPSTSVIIGTGAINSKVISTMKNTSADATNTTVYDSINVKEPVKTQFIALNRFITKNANKSDK